MQLTFLVAAAVLVLAGPAAARCNEPYAPVVKINANATKQDVAALMNDVKAFIAASDVYQACLAGGGPRLEANQKEKERVGREFNTALRAYLASHPS
jgi:hypothetical protein